MISSAWKSQRASWEVSGLGLEDGLVRLETRKQGSSWLGVHLKILAYTGSMWVTQGGAYPSS